MRVVSTLQLMAQIVFCFCTPLYTYILSYIYSTCSTCFFFSSSLDVDKNDLSFYNFQLQISKRCFCLLRDFVSTESCLDYWKLRASTQYFCRGSIYNLYFISVLSLNNLAYPPLSVITYWREYAAPLSAKATFSSLNTFYSKYLRDPITYQPTRINYQQQFILSFPLRSRRVSYSTIREMMSLAEMGQIPRGAGSEIWQVSSCWSAQRRPQETPTLLVRFFV